MPAPAVIRTPDQRLRVFVSSTLGELAEERAAVRQAIERLRLAPVMFELGARPHPPRELYRAYLDQSHVFVGIYWQRYGWIAPGEEISGLEDEYRLAGDRPRLLYLKEPAGAREPRLAELIDAFVDDDRASYRRFTTAEELAGLVADDLAVLLSERFETGAGRDRAEREGAPLAAQAPIPVPVGALVGRDDEVRQLVTELRGGERLVTLTGMGGIGKTRVALAAAHAVAGDLPVTFVPLAAVTDADRALRTVAEHLGARPDGHRPPHDVLVDHLSTTRMLLVLDNLEQIDGIGAALADLVEAAPTLQVLATSRRALRVRAEREVPVPPLPLPELGRPGDTLQVEPAVQLFLDRARAVAAPIGEDPETLGLIAEICRRLEGIPLAIELAAARARLLAPAELLERMSDRLDVLVGGPDVPERQRTLRAVIDWSDGLLDDDARSLLSRLSTFTGGWTLEAAEAVCGDGSVDVLAAMASLLDSSMITAVPASAGAPPRFSMFESVRAYAAERLAATGGAGALAERHLGYHLGLGERAQPALCGPGQREWVARLDPERPNLRRAVQTAVERGRWADVVELTWDVVVLYFVRDAVDEPTSWLASVAEAAPDLDEVTTAKLRALHALTRIHRGEYDGVRADLEEPLALFEVRGMDFESAVALHQLGFVRYRVDGDVGGALAALRASSKRFDALGHDWGVGLVEAMQASVLAAEGDLHGAEVSAQRSLEHARAIDNEPQVVQALQQLAFIRLLEQREADALALLEESALLLRRNGLRTDATYCLDALALVALVGGDVATAAEAAAVAAHERSRLGVAPWPSLEGSIERVAQATRRRLGDAEADARHRAAADRDLFEVLDATLAALSTIG